MRCANRPGLTLVEVVAATALVGALLAATLVAVGRQTQQVRRAQDRIAALEVIDELLHAGLVEGGGFEQGEGEVLGREGWRWRLRGRLEPGLEPLGAHVGRLEIVNGAEETLASIEFVSTSPVTAAQAGGAGF